MSQLELRDFIDLYYNSDTKKARAWHVEEEAAIDFIHRLMHDQPMWARYSTDQYIQMLSARTKKQIKMFLELHKDVRIQILGLPLILSNDKRGVWLEVDP